MLEVQQGGSFYEGVEAVDDVVNHHFAEQPVVHAAGYSLQHLVVD